MTSQHNPSPVLKFVAGMILFITSAALVAIAILKSQSFNVWLVVAAAIPSVAALIMMFDTVREGLLKLISRVPWVKYNGPKPKDGA